ncbi:MAG TPA: hypothetical protein VGD46_05050 [Rhizobacter sp.]
MSGSDVFFGLLILAVLAWGIRSYIRKRGARTPTGGAGGGGDGDGTPKQQL